MNTYKSCKNLFKISAAPALAIFGLVGVVFLQKPRINLEEEKLSKAKYIRQEQSETIRVSFLNKLPAFGFSNLVADWVFLKFLLYFGEGKARPETGYSLVPEYFEAVVNHDPRFIQAYLALSPATSLYAGQPQKTVTLIEEGLQSISPEISRKSPYLWMYKGSDEMLFLGDTEAAQHSYEMAAKWAETYDNPQSQSLAANARQTAQFLANNSQSKQARVGAWSMILSNAPDEATRQRAIKEIEALGGEVIVTPQGRMKVKTP